jgi:hypothetical protein
MSACTTRYTDFFLNKKRIYLFHPQIMNWTVLASLAAAEPNCTQKKWVHEQAQKN